MYNEETLKVWGKFSRWLEKTYGEGLETVHTYSHLKSKAGKPFQYTTFNYDELSKRLVGYAVMVKVEKYVKRYCPEIKIIHVDDALFSSSDILLIPHPEHGITVMFIPQCSETQNQFFLYEEHCCTLIKELTAMKKIYRKEPIDMSKKSKKTPKKNRTPQPVVSGKKKK